MTKGTLQGWIATKKRGRDDVQIARDRARAVASRRQAPSHAHQSAPTHQTLLVARKAGTKKKRRSTDWADDDDDSLNDFVVDDEEVDLDEDDDDEADFDETLLEEEEDEDDRIDCEAAKQAPINPKSSRGKKQSLDSSGHEGSHQDEFRGKAKVPTKNAKKSEPSSRQIHSGVPSRKTGVMATPITKEKVLAALLDSDEEMDRLPSGSKFTGSNTSSSRFFGKSMSSSVEKSTPQKVGHQVDEVDTPLQLNIKRKKVVGKTYFLEDTDEEENTKTAVVQSSRVTEDDYISDPDEAVALAWALQESTGESRTDTIQPASKPLAKATPVFLEDSEEESNNIVDDQNDDEQDVYVDEDAKAAGSVLQTANELSSQVLQSMANWSATTVTSSTGAVPMGIIADGALALACVDNPTKLSSSNDSRHDWISQEVMRDILPDVTLADYQLIGVNWMALLHGMKCEVTGRDSHTNVNGVLADEMGLGKTVQTIAFLSWLKHCRVQQSNQKASSSGRHIDLTDSEDERNDKKQSIEEESMDYPHLVVAPASVLSNWEREFERFAPHLNVVKYHGSMNERSELQEDLRIYLPSNRAARKKHKVTPLDVILVPITYFQKEKSDDRSFLRRFNYHYMVVDEAHLLKNAKGLRYKSLDRFTTLHRLLLTGTPVQNSPKELMCLLCFLMPLFSRKGGSDFDDEQGNDGGESMLQHFVSMEGGNTLHDETAYKKLKQLFAPFVLRRRKQDVLSQIMPPKEHAVEIVQLDESSRCLYDKIISDHIRSKKKGDASSREHLFTQLRKCAHHPLLLRARYTSPTEKEHLAKWFYQYGAFRGEGCTMVKVREELDRFNDFEIHLTALELLEENRLRHEQLGRYVLQEKDLFSSAKCKRLRAILPDLVGKGHRILIFSVWTSCLDLLSCLMEQMGLGYLRMEGSTPVNERQALIDRFTSETSIPVFLLSTKACGLGINLTCADTCIMHDLDFNPFNDLQAEDRCHRIGQKKPVKIIKMITEDTVDEDIYKMQQRKARMNAAIMDTDSREWNNVAANEKGNMLKHAVDRFLRSPTQSRSSKERGDKENSGNIDMTDV